MILLDKVPLPTKNKKLFSSKKIFQAPTKIDCIVYFNKSVWITVGNLIYCMEGSKFQPLEKAHDVNIISLHLKGG